MMAPVRRTESRIEGVQMPRRLFMQASASARDYMLHFGRLPSEIWLDGQNVLSPKDFIASAGSMIMDEAVSASTPSYVKYVAGNEDWGRYVTPQHAKETWEWVCLPKGFYSQDLYALAQLQCWSLKPALAREVGA